MMTTEADSHLTGFRGLLPPAVTAAFGACAAMLIAAYVLHFPGLNLAGGLVGIAMVVVAAIAFFLLLPGVGRRGLGRTGALGGALAGLVSLIAMGASRGEEQSAAGFALTLGGWVVLLTALGALAGYAARGRAWSAPREPAGWVPVLGVITAVSTLALITMGGIVTAAEAGLAVPDWPASFGENMFLLPHSKMTETSGVYYEHAHRLMGAFVGLSTIAILTLALAVGRGTLVKKLVFVALLLVIVQGVLGGVRVTEAAVGFAVFHAVSAQVFLALIVVIALASSRVWADAPRSVAASRLPLVALIILFVQIGLGAVARHFPDSWHGVITHAAFSLVAACAVIAAGARASKTEDALLRRLGKSCVHTVGLQMVLGVAALGVVMMTRDAETAPALDLAVTTAHQVVGALLFSVTGLLWVWWGRVGELE